MTGAVGEIALALVEQHSRRDKESAKDPFLWDKEGWIVKDLQKLTSKPAITMFLVQL